MFDPPIFRKVLADHVFAWLQPDQPFTPPPRPTRHDAERVVAGIEGKAIVSAGMTQHLGVRL